MEETSTSLQEQTTVTEIQFDRKKVFEIIRELNIRNGAITFNTDGSITAKGDEIDLKNKEAGEDLESAKVKEENLQLSFDQDEKKSEQENERKVNREQFNWWGILFLFVIIVFLTLIIK
ncbi:hypothetical protein ACKUSY_15940 [Myroides odoratus]